MATPTNEGDQAGLLRRWQAMGLRARMMEGGRSVVASLPLSPAPFEGLRARSLRIETVIFASVGLDRIKCLRPRSLFQLPMIRIPDCRGPDEIEDRIRSAWRGHVAGLERARAWLGSLGTEVEVTEEGSVLAFSIAGEEPSARGRVVEPRRVVLPGRGPLSGFALDTPEERVFEAGAGISSGIDLEIAISNRLEELGRGVRERAEAERRRSLEADSGPPGSPVEGRRRHRILLVGPRLSRERAHLESLAVRGYDVEAVSGERQALEAFTRQSPELVISDVELERSGGPELILALREVVGVENLPVVLVDTQARSARRELARQVGAAGYLVYPLDMGRIARRLEQLLESVKQRRFTRYPRRLAVEVAGARSASLATSLSRGGMFLASDAALAAHTLHDFRISLPEVGETLGVSAEVLYRVGGAGAARRGHGLRFHAFADGAEPLLIDYLRRLGPVEH